MFVRSEERARTRSDTAQTQAPDIGATDSTPTVLRKSACSCGGGCPSCQASAGNLKVSQPNDASEIEADTIADRVMRMRNDQTSAFNNVPAGSRDDSIPHVRIDAAVVHRQGDEATDEEPDPITEGLSTVTDNLSENNPAFSEFTDNLADEFLSQPPALSVGVPVFLGANYAFLWGMALANPAMRRHFNDFNIAMLPGIVPQFPIKTFTYRILNDEQTQFEFDFGLDASALMEAFNEGVLNTHVSTLSFESSGGLNTEAESPVSLSALQVNLGLFDDGLMLSGGFRQGVSPYPLMERNALTGETSQIGAQFPAMPDLFPERQDVRFMIQLDVVRLYNYFNPDSPPIRLVPREVEGDVVDQPVQRKHSAATAASAATFHAVPSSNGQPLDDETRNFFESRIGHDLGSLRIHTGDAAAESARSVNARAYTLGSDIVFGSGEYAPHSESGRHLIAHELAHVAQHYESGSRRTLHRTLKVDAAASDDPATAVSTVDPLITSLCPDFEMNAAGFVVPKAGTPCSIPRFAAVAGGGHPLGCCCLCTMTRPFGALWKIVVSSTNAPSTIEGSKEVRMTPTSGPSAPELRHWSAGPVETTSTQQPVEAFGHELCGHAALMKIRAHPTDVGDTDRSYSDVHDPTVRVQNALATEMGLAGTRRGLAGGGTHRGESLRVFNVGPFPANDSDPTPFAAQIAAAVAFLNGKPELLFDIVGFRVAADTTAAVSATRASRVRASIVSALTTVLATVETSPGVDETLPRPQPPTDGGVGGSPVVEIRMAIRPAGLLTPIGVPPPATSVHVDEEVPGRVAALKGGSVNQCHQLLASTAWP